MVKKVFLSPIHELTSCLVANHFGSAGYGGIPRAAQIAVDEYGIGWLAKEPQAKKDKEMREFLRKLTKLSCPSTHSNRDQPWQVLQRGAKKYASMNFLLPAKNAKSQKTR